MRLGLLLAFAVAAQVSAQPVDPCKIPELAPYLPQCPKVSFAAFEFAPGDGTGMGTACACTTPTGVHGEVLTFTRASSGTCFKHSQTTGIANGDLVTCSSGQPRVMSGGVGVLGLMNEGSRTNTTPQSEAFDNAAWSKAGSGAAAPTVTANAAAGPDNNTTADRVQFPATTAGQFSDLLSPGGCTASASNAESVFIKGTTSSGVLGLCFCAGALCGGTSDFTCAPMAYNTSTWTRYAQVATLGIQNHIFFATQNGDAAADVLLYGAQCEVGTFESSYIATTTAAVTRALEVATLPFVNGATTGSFAATIVPVSAVAGPWGNDQDHEIFSLSTAGPVGVMLLDARAASSTLTFYLAAGAVGSGEWGITGLTENRVAGYWTGTGGSASVVGALGGTSVGSGTAGATTLIEVGTFSGVAPAYGVIKKVCADSDPTRCR